MSAELAALKAEHEPVPAPLPVADPEPRYRERRYQFRLPRKSEPEISAEVWRMTEKVKQKTKTITIKETTWRRLKSAGTMGDTFDSVINRALDCYESITVR